MSSPSTNAQREKTSTSDDLPSALSNEDKALRQALAASYANQCMAVLDLHNRTWAARMRALHERVKLAVADADVGVDEEDDGLCLVDCPLPMDLVCNLRREFFARTTIPPAVRRRLLAHHGFRPSTPVPYLHASMSSSSSSQPPLPPTTVVRLQGQSIDSAIRQVTSALEARRNRSRQRQDRAVETAVKTTTAADALDLVIRRVSRAVRCSSDPCVYVEFACISPEMQAYELGYEKMNSPTVRSMTIAFECAAFRGRCTYGGCGGEKQPDRFPDTRVCARCREAPYCSRACQTADWVKHRAACVPVPHGCRAMTLDDRLKLAEVFAPTVFRITTALDDNASNTAPRTDYERFLEVRYAERTSVVSKVAFDAWRKCVDARLLWLRGVVIESGRSRRAKDDDDDGRQTRQAKDDKGGVVHRTRRVKGVKAACQYIPTPSGADDARPREEDVLMCV